MGKKTYQLLISQLDIEYLVGENACQKMISRTITLPAGLENPVILAISPQLKGITTEVFDDKVLVEGRLEGSITYVADEEKQTKDLGTEEFSVFVDLPGAKPEMKGYTHSRVESVEHHLLDASEPEAHFLQKTVIEIMVKVTKRLQEDVVTGIEGIDPAFITTDKFAVTSVVGEGAESISLVKEYDLDFPADYIEADAVLSDVEALPFEGGVSFTADLEFNIAYIGEDHERIVDNPVEQIRAEISIPGAKPEAQAEIMPRVMLTSAAPDLENPGRAVISVLVDVFVRVTETVEKELVTAAEGLLLANDFIRAGLAAGSIKINTDLEEKHLLEGKVSEAVVESVQIRDLCGEISGEQVLISGLLEKVILYKLRDEETGYKKFQAAEEFTEAVTLPGLDFNAGVVIYPRIEDICLNIENDNIIETTKMTAEVKAVLPVELEVVVTDEIEEIPEDAALIIYVVRQDDTVFKISRRFGVPMEVIISANNLEDPELIYPGEKFLIPVNQVN